MTHDTLLDARDALSRAIRDPKNERLRPMLIRAHELVTGEVHFSLGDPPTDPNTPRPAALRVVQ